MPTFKYSSIPEHGHYIEILQANPIHWAILEKNDNTFTNLSHWMKCRDFFNDVIYTAHSKKEMRIYGFNTKNLINKVVPDKPLYLVVAQCRPDFHANVKVLNTFLESHNVPTISVESTDVSGQFILTLDPYYLQSTYNISLITLLIRFINCNKELKDIKELNETVLGYEDNLKLERLKKEKKWFSMPKNKNSDFYYWAGEYNSKTSLFTESIVHNNGVINWYDNMRVYE